MIEVTYNKADGSVANHETLTSGMVNTIYVRFNLSSDWQGLSKIAVFSNGIRTIDILEEDWDTQNTCRVPHEVLELPWQTVRVGLQGMDGDNIILPAVMCRLGRVKPGTTPGDDFSTDSTLPVWAQLQTHMAQLLENSCSTTLEKNPTGTDTDDTTIRIHLNGIDSLDGSPELWVYQCIRRRKKATYWRHPATWDSDGSDGRTKLGYGLIAQTDFACRTDGHGHVYPAIPDWMPNNGFLQTVFPIDDDVLQTGYIDLHPSTWLLPLLKPTDTNLIWRKCGFIGTQGSSEQAPALFQFCIVKNGSKVGTTGQTLCIGFRRNEAYTPYLPENGRLYTDTLYTSIRN